MIYELENVCYAMDLGCGSDTWRIFGYCPKRGIGRGFISPSSPVSFDKKEQTFTTSSGSIYKVVSWNETSEYIHDKFWEQIEKDINEKGYEVH